MGQSTFSGPVASQNGFTSGSFTTAERDALTNVQLATLIFNSTDSELQVYNGTSWQAAFGGGGGGGTTFTRGTDFNTGFFSAPYSQSLVIVDGNPAMVSAMTAAAPGAAFTMVDTSMNSYSGTLTLGWQYDGMEYYAPVSGVVIPNGTQIQTITF